MKRLLIAASCVALLAPSLSLAQAAPDRTRPAPGQPPGGGPNRPGPGKPDRPGAGNPGGGANRPTPGRPNPPRPGAGGPNRPVRPPPKPVHRPPHRPHFGWNGHRYRAGLFRYPPGYSYRRWTIGQTLPFLFLSSAYFYDNYLPLGLEPPPFGCRWVRYGPDILLVEVGSRRIRGVVRNVFF